MKHMRIVFSDHARQQMRERNLSESAIRAAILHPQSVVRQTNRRIRSVAFLPKSHERYVIVVVYDVITKERREVVTAFITSKLNKYL